ncbi:hypothetical protein LTR84_010114 [Exophiala bonariae]|uniref:N-acetyltransferase domain-containing protein n=1 Tax=Exophiala bonariae TaxID=1690606 RepID=A0AAV9NLC5_9EURO|nr:hypothetical protein LTR84_010114 [Exophiala bonariae]
MGRHHGLKFPEHLYLSPPTPPPQPTFYSLASASSFLSVKSASHYYYSSPAALFQETSRNTALAVSDRIPGLKTSADTVVFNTTNTLSIGAAFLTTLRANLVLESDSTPPSLANTPDCLRPINMASSTGSLSAPLPSPLAQSASSFADNQDEHLDSSTADQQPTPPPLTTTLALTLDDKVEALHLLADSVAQQRQLASKATIFHPSTLSLLILALGLVYQYFYHGAQSDLALVGTTGAGIVMSALITVRWLTGGYIEEAERIGTWKWLNLGRDEGNGNTNAIIGEEDEILLTRFGDEVIGTLFLRGVRESNSSSNSGGGGSDGMGHSSSLSSSSGNSSPTKRAARAAARNTPVTGQIRGWTVKQRFRHKGVGTGLLEEAVAATQRHGWLGPEFAADHANSAKLLPMTFLGGFVKREKLAREALVRVKTEMGVSAGGGRGGRRTKR